MAINTLFSCLVNQEVFQASYISCKTRWPMISNAISLVTKYEPMKQLCLVKFDDFAMFREWLDFCEQQTDTEFNQSSIKKHLQLFGLECLLYRSL